MSENEPLRGDERYLDEVETRPPARWPLALRGLGCLLLLGIVVVGSRLLLFPDMSWLASAIRTAIVLGAIGAIWFGLVQRRFSRVA
jgi:hypothetical protein